ncbi:MAG TPA: oligoendopeptidase F family protein, partial [Gelria sp.]|nr:oligoendopeptidase F family protein [Gelria sp.]
MLPAAVDRSALIASKRSSSGESICSCCRELKQYRHFMEELWRQQEHILSPEEERLLAMSADLSTAAGS